MKGKLWFALAIALLMGMTAFAGSKVLGIVSEYRAGEDAYEQMAQYAVQPSAQPMTTRQPQQDDGAKELPTETADAGDAPAKGQEMLADVQFPVVDFAALQKINPEVVAWITIEGTRVNYPVVQGEDNEYYLKRMIDGERNAAGSIFMDCKNAADLTDDNTVIYGHNMNNGSMFADVRKYREQEYYEKHPQVLVMTPEGNYVYDIVAGYVATLRGEAWQTDFETTEKAEEWIEKTRRLSAFESVVQAKAGDRFLTLSTCTYEVDDARFVLVAVQRNAQE